MLPTSPPPPRVDKMTVFQKLLKLKNTRSTHPIDLPAKLRQEYSIFLVDPLCDIFNTCLQQHTYPALWKHEYVTPVPKINHPTEIKHLRKISGTSDYSKLFENILKDWLMEDLSPNIDQSQYGGKKGIGPEHMILSMVDRILKLLDSNKGKPAVIAAAADWANAFDRVDPTLATLNFIRLGVRPSLIPILISFMTNRKMTVKFNGCLSNPKPLVGGGPQGTLHGQTEYIVASDSCTRESVSHEDRFKYMDDLTVLELIALSSVLTEYDFIHHVSSQVGIDEKYLPPSNTKTQDTLNDISDWTKRNLMLLNEEKSNYIIFTRSKQSFKTQLSMNNKPLEQLSVTKLLGVWLQEDLGWDKNTKEICKKAYSRVSMLTKLKYVGINTEELINIYKLFIRSVTEYCSVVFHSSLTQLQSNKIENIQKTCLKIILSDNYVSYNAALEMCNLSTLHDRRQSHCRKFSLKCLNNPQSRKLFPPTSIDPDNIHTVRNREKFKVNRATTEQYRMSAVPSCQRLLNEHFKQT